MQPFANLIGVISHQGKECTPLPCSQAVREILSLLYIACDIAVLTTLN